MIERRRFIGFLVTNVDSLHVILRTAEPLLQPSSPRLGVGMQMSVEMMSADMRVGSPPARRSKAPTGQDARRALSPDRSNARLIGSFTTERCPLILHAQVQAQAPGQIIADVERMFEFIDRAPDLLRVDVTSDWLPPEVIDVLHKRYEELGFIVRLGDLVQMRGQGPEEGLQRFRELYVAQLESKSNPITHVLWDGSGGRRIPLESDLALRFVRELRRSFPDLMPMVAGWLGPGSLGRVDDIWSETSDFSIDAQGQLARTFGEAPDVARTIDYIKEALQRYAAAGAAAVLA